MVLPAPLAGRGKGRELAIDFEEEVEVGGGTRTYRRLKGFDCLQEDRE